MLDIKADIDFFNHDINQFIWFERGLLDDKDRMNELSSLQFMIYQSSYILSS